MRQARHIQIPMNQNIQVLSREIMIYIWAKNSFILSTISLGQSYLSIHTQLNLAI